MNTPRYAASAAKLLRRHLPSGTRVVGDEPRGVATIERAVLVRTKRRRLVGLGSVLAAAAAVAVLATQIHRWRQAEPSGVAAVSIDVAPAGSGAALAHHAGEEALTGRVAMASGQRIDTPAHGGASIRLSTGTSMKLAGETSFRVDSQGATQRFSLQRGELVAQVAKLANAQRFIVDTPDAEVEVRGTRFRLRVIEQPEACAAGTRTRLEVTEGVVEVRAASLGSVSVRAGEVWPKECQSTAGAPSSAPAEVAQLHAGAPKQDARAAASALPSEPDRPSALAAPNDLFAEGVAKGRQGDTGGALRVYQALISRFPSSPLAENAMVARMRLLAGSADGRAEAQRYLARYPHGFGLNEAKKLLAEP